MVFRPKVTELSQMDKILVVFRPASVEIVMVSGNQIDVPVFQRVDGPFTVKLRAGIDVESVFSPYSRLLGQYPKWSVRFGSVDYFQFAHATPSFNEIFVFNDRYYRCSGSTSSPGTALSYSARPERCRRASGSGSKSLRLLSAQIKLVAPSLVKRIRLHTPPGKTLS